MAFKTYSLTLWQVFLVVLVLGVTFIPENNILGVVAECDSCHGFPVPFYSANYSPTVPFVTIIVFAVLIDVLFWNFVVGIIMYSYLRFVYRSKKK